tara:strand:+ start:58 stop:276 length:219 start_codon:yes stop_codon:yes gene_type:complete
MSRSLFNIYYFSPTFIIGFWLLFIGIIFTGIMFYFVFFRLNLAEGSLNDRKKRKLAKEKQKERIAKLYPKEN